MLGEELAEHGGILVRHRRTELGEHAGRQVEAGGDGIEVTGAGAGAGADQELVVRAGGDDLVHQRIERGAATVDHALAADLDDGGIGEDAEVRRGVGGREKLRVRQGALHQQRVELCRRVHRGKVRLAGPGRACRWLGAPVRAPDLAQALPSGMLGLSRNHLGA
ncbi:hypothetical protein J2126_002076 [Xanthobacter flavus]|nr:hypothetical protein [Xanthobacter flavus]